MLRLRNIALCLQTTFISEEFGMKILMVAAAAEE